MPLGHYRWVFAGGLTLLYAVSPYYGKREQYLPAVKRTMLQVLVKVLGSLMWINIDPSDIID